MKNSLVRKMFIILFITVVAVAAGVYGITYAMSYNTMMNDIRQRANGVRTYIAANITVEDIEAIGEDSEYGEQTRKFVNDMLSQLKNIGNLKNLYFVQINEHGQLFTSMSAFREGDETYIPRGLLAEDLKKSMTEQVLITGTKIYQTEHGNVYSMFWPVINEKDEILGVVGMEFDVDNVYHSYRRMAVYSIAFSAALIVLFSIIAFLSMNKASEPFYKKLAYMDLLTGYENRMSFEQRLREAGTQVDRGKSITLMIFDVNDLKVVNDTFGHKQGDAYLRNTADILSQHIGDAGLLYRIGGDEFASVISENGESEGERILAAVRSEDSPVLKDHLFSCASGAATYERGVDRNMRDVFARADHAMYEDKRRMKALKEHAAPPPAGNAPEEPKTPRNQ